MSVYRVSEVGRPSWRSQSTEVPRSVDRVAKVGPPTPPMSVDRNARVGLPKVPRGAGDDPSLAIRFSRSTAYLMRQLQNPVGMPSGRETASPFSFRTSASMLSRQPLHGVLQLPQVIGREASRPFTKQRHGIWISRLGCRLFGRPRSNSELSGRETASPFPVLRFLVLRPPPPQNFQPLTPIYDIIRKSEHRRIVPSRRERHVFALFWHGRKEERS